LRLSADDVNLVAATSTCGVPSFCATDRRLALPLFQAKGIGLRAAVLLLAVNNRGDGERFVMDTHAQIEVAGRHLRRALESAKLQTSLKRLERSEKLQRALFAISDLAGSDLDMPDMLRGIQAIVGTLMYAENFYIVLHDAERDTLRFLYYADVEDPAPPGDNREIPMSSLERSLTWYLLRDGKPLMGKTEELRKQVSGPLAIMGPDSEDWLGVPMLRDGRACGAVVVQSYQPGIQFTVDDRNLLEFVDSHILIALERKQSKEDLEQRVRARTTELAEANRVLQTVIVEQQRGECLQAALFQIAQLGTVDISQSEFYRRVHAIVGELINAENFYIGLLSGDRRSLEFPYYVDAQRPAQPARPLARGLSEFVIHRGSPWMGMTADIQDLARRGEIELPYSSNSPAICWLGVPLLVDDEVIGLVAVQSYVPHVVYASPDEELLTFVASQVATSLHRRRSAENLHRAYSELEQRVQERTQELSKEIAERERIQRQLTDQVMHDALTGLPNRGYLLDRLERVLAHLKREPDERCALLFIDVDRFKVINDSLGHMVGDNVLKEVAHRLLTCVREPDLVARLSGDEFAILLEDAPTPATAVKVAQRVLGTLSMPLSLGGTELTPSASIGIAFGDHRYDVAGHILRDADTAMYRAKKTGRGRFELFDDSLQQAASNVLTLEGELRTALVQDQFEPYFQPIVRLDSGEHAGYEALIRWHHPTRGTLGPHDFMKVAEDSGSIEAIDWRMFELSCKSAVLLDNPQQFLTINVSPRHLYHAEFGARLLAILQRTGLLPSRLLLELTEGSLIDQPERVRANLEQLRNAGIGAVLDDFGTGYSSLSYLHTFPLRMLKIDRSFVTQLCSGSKSSTSVVAAVLALAQALEMDVVAEGIEKPEQRDTLLAMGCRFGQGYLLGRPAPIARWLSASSEASESRSD
jgi:diguanylate cyclase (GGDEF)-like protein